jgi:protein-S-isoprenylcysteine O-methyltransferase Ste14
MTTEILAALAGATVSPGYAKAVMLLANVLMIAIRAPHGQRSRWLAVVMSRRTRAENFALKINAITYFFPLLWIVTPVFGFADYGLRAAPFYLGVCCLLCGMYLFRRSHSDLGDNFSNSLELRARHQLVTCGIYAFVRHPMYLALFVYLVGETLVIPNWFVGPAELLAMLLLFVIRVGPEERMLLEAFGPRYGAYAIATKRLVPRVW